MAAGRWSFTIEKGADFHRTLRWLSGGSPVDLTGYTALLQIRKSPEGVLYTEFSSTPGSDGLITFDALNGTIELFMDSTVTETLEWEGLSWSGRAYYDLLLISPTDTETRLLEGRVRLSEPVTVP